jgi:hypothetical protein
MISWEPGSQVPREYPTQAIRIIIVLCDYDTNPLGLGFWLALGMGISYAREYRQIKNSPNPQFPESF